MVSKNGLKAGRDMASVVELLAEDGAAVWNGAVAATRLLEGPEAVVEDREKADLGRCLVRRTFLG